MRDHPIKADVEREADRLAARTLLDMAQRARTIRERMAALSDARRYFRRALGLVAALAILATLASTSAHAYARGSHGHVRRPPIVHRPR